MSARYAFHFQSNFILTVKNKKLFEAFKNYDVFKDGEFSRYKVGQLIFSDEKARQIISSIMHPQIADEIKKFFDVNKSEEFLFVGIPLLFEANMQSMFDKIIFIYADDDLRLERLLKRNNYTTEHAMARIASQMPQNLKLNKSDYVLNNKGSLEDLSKAVDNLLSVIS